MLILNGESRALSLTFTPDGTRLVVGRGDGHVDAFTLPSGELIHQWGPFGRFNSVAVHPLGQFVFVGSDESLCEVPLDGSPPRTGPPSTRRVIASPSGKWILVQSQTSEMYGLNCDSNGKVQGSVWESESGRVFLGSFVGQYDQFVTIEGNAVAVRDAATGAALSVINYPSPYVFQTATSPDGRTFAAMGSEKLYVWDTTTWGKPIRVEIPFGVFAFHPTRPLFGAIQRRQTLVKFFDTVTWKLHKRFAWKLGELVSFAFSPDGTLAAAGSTRGTVVVWDLDD